MAEEKREKWSSKIDFLLSCLGYAVGLGNVWRFPYLCAAFLIPYFVMMIFAGFPTFYMELALGQYAGLSPIKLFNRICPLFTGCSIHSIAYCMVIISGYTAIYYNMIIAWALYYMVNSFRATMPWVGCDNEWNTKRCYDDTVGKDCEDSQFYFAGKCFNDTVKSVDFQGQSIDRDLIDYLMRVTVTYNDQKTSDAEQIAEWKTRARANGTWREIETSTLRRSPAKEYNNYVLGIYEKESADSRIWTLGGIEEMGLPKWELVLSLAGAWVLLFLCLARGIKSSGKVVYFTATFPYIILLILFVRGITLDGAGDGLDFYLNPDWKLVGESKTWSAAANQIFFSLSLGWGGLTTLASYNDFHNNLLRDTLLVVIGNCATSIFAGFVIFPIIGFVALQTQQSASGPSLAFVAYPSALAQLSPPALWSVLFFFMLVLLGIDSQLVLVEVVITSIVDWFPHLRKGWKKAIVVLLVCVVMFAFGIILTCPGGNYLLNLVDTYAGGWTLVIACLFEVSMVSYVYGIRRFIEDIKMMMGPAPSKFWKCLGYPSNMFWYANWFFITPILLLFVLIFSWVSYTPITLGEYSYPVWGDAIGWTIALSAALWIPGVAIFMIVKAVVKGEFKWLVVPSDDWMDHANDERWLGEQLEDDEIEQELVEDQESRSRPDMSSGSSSKSSAESDATFSSPETNQNEYGAWN